jgi:hypothetical protein
MIDLEGLLPGDHRARLVWSFVEASIFRPFTIRFFRARAKRDGRPPILQFSWRCGFMRRSKGWDRPCELERLAQSDVAYRGLAGGVPLNYHGLADFRVEQVEVLDRLLTQSVTALIGEGLMSLAEIAVDGQEDSRQRQQGVVQDGRKTHQDRSRGRRAAGRSQAGISGRSGSVEPLASRAGAGDALSPDAETKLFCR